LGPQRVHQETGPKTKIIESEGETIFDAIRNAKKRLVNKLYFGQSLVVVISEHLAREEGVGNVIEWFLRDSEPRETMILGVSQEKTAQALLVGDGSGQEIVSRRIKQIAEDDGAVTASTVKYMIYEIYVFCRKRASRLSCRFSHGFKQHQADRRSERDIRVQGPEARGFPDAGRIEVLFVCRR
jgi:hypothetical protein